MSLNALPGIVNTAFRFVVAIDGAPVGAFTECVLPDITWQPEEVKEGGLNTYVHQLPGPRQTAKVTLKNGVGVARHLLSWYLATMNERIVRRQVTITLLSPYFEPKLALHIEDVYPIKWSGPRLETGENSVAIQTLELACGEITLLQV